jgi:hypothetical protein
VHCQATVRVQDRVVLQAELTLGGV